MLSGCKVLFDGAGAWSGSVFSSIVRWPPLRRRGRFTDCKFEYNMSHLLPHILVYLEGRMVWVVCAGAMVIILAVLIILPEFLV